MESSSRNIASSSGLEEVADGGVKEEDGSFDIARLMSKIFVVARRPRDCRGGMASRREERMMGTESTAMKPHRRDHSTPLKCRDGAED